jgi:hypothetical protein
MNSKLLFHKALTMCLTFALIATYSMVALASDGKATGEITITGSSDNSVVTVNGEAVKSGRTIFSSSTITTQDGAKAVVNLGKAGRLEIAPNTTFTLSFDKTAISGDLALGSITVLSAAQSVNVKTAVGETVVLNAGDTATASSSSPSQSAAASSSPNWAVFALIFGGAIAGIVLATSQDNENRFGSGTTVSPTS